MQFLVGPFFFLFWNFETYFEDWQLETGDRVSSVETSHEEKKETEERERDNKERMIFNK